MIDSSAMKTTGFYADMGRIEVKDGEIHLTCRHISTLDLDHCFSLKEPPYCTPMVEGFHTDFHRIIYRDGTFTWI